MHTEINQSWMKQLTIKTKAKKRESFEGNKFFVIYHPKTFIDANICWLIDVHFYFLRINWNHSCIMWRKTQEFDGSDD